MSERYYEPTYEELREELKKTEAELRKEKEIAKMNAVGDKWKTDRIKILEGIIVTLKQKNNELENQLIIKEKKKERKNIPLLLIIAFWCLILLAGFLTFACLLIGFDGEETLFAFLGFVLLVPTLFSTYINVKFTISWVQKTTKYKEKCYKRINRLRSYYESGAITEEEFNNLKQEILSKIK